MDHLPPVLTPVDPIRVPYLGGVYRGTCLINYVEAHNVDCVDPPRRDTKCFEEYPEAHGWSLKKLQRGDLADEQRESAARFIQEWFYFGMLRTILFLSIDEEDDLMVEMVENDAPANSAPTLRVNSQHLMQYVDMWKQSIEKMFTLENTPGQEMLDDYKKQVASCLATSHAAWKAFKDFPAIAGGLLGREVGEAIELSILVLGSTLGHMARKMHLLQINSPGWAQAICQPLVNRMLDQGWCPSVIERLSWPAHNTVLYFASLFGPPVQPRGYEALSVRHSECDKFASECQRRVFNDDNYETAHSAPGCACAFVGPAEEVLRTILETKDAYSPPDSQMGGIPLVYWDEKKQILKTVPYTPDKQYTAISHVWSDGIGNVTKNSLPTCQIRRLVDYIKPLPWTEVLMKPDMPLDEKVWKPVSEAPHPRVPGFHPLRNSVASVKRFFKTMTWQSNVLDKQPLYFWIDTLCVPVTASGSDRQGRSLRKIAMIGIKAAYARANRVLVLDSDLLRVTGTPEDVEIRMRICVSTWSHRLWTLQEGVLAKAVWYQLRDVAVKADDNGRDEEEDWKDEVRSWLNIREVNVFQRQTKFVARITAFASTEEAARDRFESPLNLEGLKVSTVWSTLQKRCAKNPLDEPLCVATLLDMDLAELLSVDSSQRIIKHWSMYKHGFPAGVLMLPGHKQPQHAIRWAPLSLAECWMAPSPKNRLAMPLGDGRVEVNLPGVILFEVNEVAARKTVLTITINDEVWYIRENLLRGNAGWATIDFSKPSSYALILGAEPSPVGGRIRDVLLAFHLVALASVEKVDAEDGTMHVTWLNACSFIKQGSAFDAPGQWTVRQVKEMREDKQKATVVKAAFTDIEQRWVIS